MNWQLAKLTKSQSEIDLMVSYLNPIFDTPMIECDRNSVPLLGSLYRLAASFNKAINLAALRCVPGGKLWQRYV